MTDVADSRLVRAYLACRPARWVALVLVVVGGFLLVLVRGNHPIAVVPFDLEIYRFGGQVLLQGGDIYGPLPDTTNGLNLPFTYPPLAAVLFAPLALLPLWLAHLLFTLTTYVGLAAVVALVLRAMSRLRGAELWWVTVAVMALALWLGPVRETVAYGQINVILMALVVVDLVGGRGRWWQGSLIGLAMAVKLTPAVFLAYFLVRRDWRQLVMAVGSAIAFTGVGFLFTWNASIQYWTETITDPGRIGNLYYVSNQSINGLLVRLGLSDGGGAIWFLLCAVVGLGLLVVMWRLFAIGQDVAAMLAMAVFALVASPVSWSHHWVWVVPALLLLTVWAYRANSPWVGGFAAIGALIFFSRLPWRMPREESLELTWNWWQQILGNSQLLWGVGFLIALAVVACRPGVLDAEPRGSSVE